MKTNTTNEGKAKKKKKKIIMLTGLCTCLYKVPHNKNNTFHCEPPELSLYPIQLIYNNLADRFQHQFCLNPAFVLNASSPPKKGQKHRRRKKTHY